MLSHMERQLRDKTELVLKPPASSDAAESTSVDNLLRGVARIDTVAATTRRS